MTAIATALMAGLLLSAPEGDWKRVDSNGGVVVSTRERPGTGLLEVRAIKTIDAPPAAVLQVIQDVSRYPETMPHIKKAQKLAGEDHWYLQIDLPVVSDRDYAIHTRVEDRGQGKRLVWSPSKDAPPAAKGMVRMSTEGYWDLAPAEGNRTQVTYYVYADPSGSLPKFLANKGAKDSLPELMTAVEKHARALATKQ